MNAAGRPTPFGLVFGAMAPDRFPLLERGLLENSADPHDRDAFLMVTAVVELLRELRPDEGLGEAMSTAAAFLHHSYLHWLEGEPTEPIEGDVLERLMHSEPSAVQPCSHQPSSRYVQLPPLLIWGEPVEGSPAEPLDGWFARRENQDLGILAVFGLHPGRPGLSAVEVFGPRPTLLTRLDGSAPFAATLPGGESAGLSSVAGAEELLELAWRIEALTAQPAKVPS